jgi:hypothetical protein
MDGHVHVHVFNVHMAFHDLGDIEQPILPTFTNTCSTAAAVTQRIKSSSY